MNSQNLDLEHDEEAQQRLWDMIGDMRFALVTTHGAEGRLHSRPLTLQNEPWNRSNLLHFFVPASSPLLAEVAEDERVGLGYADLLSGRYVSIGGLASVRRDPPRQAALWNAMARAWFPGGADDPELRLLEVRIETVEYWDMQANRMVPLGSIAGIEEAANDAAGLTTPSYGAAQAMTLN